MSADHSRLAQTGREGGRSAKSIAHARKQDRRENRPPRFSGREAQRRNNQRQKEHRKGRAR